ncbi:MAG: FtsX-like permease family protein [Lactobacillaceae bacterium]|jgi:putative ABC transport system permease protein|nr:FtsX-like permease family protein [Lactobacillaceae bacterium]
MKKTALSKIGWKEIFQSPTRFLSIVGIIFIGVAIYAGLTISSADLLVRAQHYFTQHELADFRLSSQYGFTQADAKKLKQVAGVQSVKLTKEITLAVKEHNAVIDFIPEPDKQQYAIVSGRMPQTKTEISLDQITKEKFGFKLGQKISLTPNMSQMQGASGISPAVLGDHKFKIVGFVNSPRFIDNKSRGNATVGKGVVDYFAIVKPAALNLAGATTAQITLQNPHKYVAYTSAYNKLAKQTAKQVSKVAAKTVSTRLSQGLPVQVQSKIYTFLRADNPGYNEYRDNSTSVEKIALVFPLFFLLVAVLIVMTTMTRMVEENRMQIGTLKALGYQSGDIAKKYILYAVLTGLFGAVIGILIGEYGLAYVIVDAFSGVYNISEFIPVHSWSLSAISVVVALICTLGVSLFVLRWDLQANPAALMQPKAPKSGKRILLERIVFIWRHLTFLQKVTVRNLFRYKTRMIMVIVGVAGCTALMVAGFGLRNSIGDILNLQFKTVYHYQATVTTTELTPAVKAVLKDTKHFDAYTPVSVGNLEKKAKQVDTQSATLMVTDKPEQFTKYVTLRDRQTGQAIKLDNHSAVVTEKFAKLFKLKVGKTFTAKTIDGKQYRLKVGGITEQYSGHAIYMTAQYYQTVMHAQPRYTTALMKFKELPASGEDKVSSTLMQDPNILNVNFMNKNREIMKVTLDSINVVVIVIIVFAGLLAFVVLYNLTNINVAERMRELSTIKVLGFYDREVTSYVYRENWILTLIGIVIGWGLGIGLHGLILATTELDNIMYSPTIHLLSFGCAGLLTIGFSLIVMLIIHFKLKNINMIEALKINE